MNKIHITKNDRRKLVDLIGAVPKRDKFHDALLTELDRAIIVEPESVPTDVVTMNTLVTFSDTATGQNHEFWLVFPDDANVAERKVSVLSPIGCALLGYKVGDIVGLSTPNGEKIIRIESIKYQPEATGNYE